MLVTASGIIPYMLNAVCRLMYGLMCKTLCLRS